MSVANADSQSDQLTRSSTQLTDEKFVNCVEDSISGWEHYPDSLITWNPFCCNGERLREKLEERSAQLFSRETELHVLDAYAVKHYQAEENVLKDASEIEARLIAPFPDLRIISIIRKNSVTPLKIAKDVLLKILQSHQIGPCFLDLLFSFRDVEELSEKGQSFWSPIRASVQSSELCYQLKYMERNTHTQGAKWSERQIGVYHRFGSQEQSVMVLLHAGPNTDAHQRVNKVFAEGQYSSRRSGSPLLLHCLILCTYLDNWRWFLDFYGRYCLEKEDKNFVVGLHHHSLSFMELQDLRNVQSKLLVARTILKATCNIIEGLEKAARRLATSNKIEGSDRPSRENDSDFDVDTLLEVQTLMTLKIKCQGYMGGIEVLQSRVEKIIKLVSDGLGLENQNSTIEIAHSAHQLTQQSVDDNAIVKVITIITVIYLPTQGVATFFGMNLTNLPDDTNRIRFAKDWWLFLATAIPLTVVTFVILLIAWLVERKKKAERERERLSISK